MIDDWLLRLLSADISTGESWMTRWRGAESGRLTSWGTGLHHIITQHSSTAGFCNSCQLLKCLQAFLCPTTICDYRQYVSILQILVIIALAFLSAETKPVWRTPWKMAFELSKAESYPGQFWCWDEDEAQPSLSVEAWGNSASKADLKFCRENDHKINVQLSGMTFVLLVTK